MLRAETIAAANAQPFRLPASFDTWRSFAGTIDGYKIAQELGFDLREWGGKHDQEFLKTGKWPAWSILEFRLMLFYLYRADYMTGYTYTEHDQQANSVLEALSKLTGQEYNREG